MNTARDKTLMIGDQLSTDILGAHLAGLTAYMVCPLVTEDLVHTRFVRILENAFLKNKEPEGVSCLEESGARSQ